MNEQRVVNAKVVGNKGNIWNKILLAIVLVCVGAAGMYAVMKLNPGTTVVNKLEKEVTVNENGIADAVEKVYNSVVVVENYRSNKLQATGTGFIFKKDGNKYYVMTNYHVIENSSKVKIVLTDDTNTEVEVVGGDKYADIAVLSFTSSSDLTVAEIGSSTDGRVGDTTFAVGAPLGDTYSGTVTKGILSGKDRLVAVSFSGSNSDYYMKVLQTDAALNPGNSGGPLCNVNGEVIGVTSLKLTEEKTSSTTSYSVEGMGFAIPIEDALSYAGIIEKGESVKRPYIGISMLDITDSYYLWQAGITLPKGVEKGVAILEVSSSSPAEKAGLKKGDIITKLEKEEISSVAELRYELYKHNPGDKVTVTYNRNGKELTSEVTLEESK